MTQASEGKKINSTDSDITKAAATAAAAATAKVNIRSFRASAEVENLYRFISEVKLRKEAKLIFQRLFELGKKINKKSAKKRPKIH